METSTLTAEKSERRFEFTQWDSEILGEFRLNPVMDLPRLSLIMKLKGLGPTKRGRSVKALRPRLQGLRVNGYLRRIERPRGDIPPVGRIWNRDHLIHYPTTKMWEYAHEAFMIPERVGMGDRRSNKNLDHDLNLTDLYIALLRDLPSIGLRIKGWERLAKFVRFENGYEPDASFEFEGEFEDEEVSGKIYWEEENSAEWGYTEEGKSARVLKCDEYWPRLDKKRDRAVFCIEGETPEDAKEAAYTFAEKLHDLGGIYNKRYWFITWGDAVRENAAGYVFISPPDYKTRTYRISGEFLE